MNSHLSKELADHIRQVLQTPTMSGVPSGHELLNTMQTVLSSIEMLGLDVLPEQQALFERLEVAALQLEGQFKTYLQAQNVMKKAIAAALDRGEPL